MVSSTQSLLAIEETKKHVKANIMIDNECLCQHRQDSELGLSRRG